MPALSFLAYCTFWLCSRKHDSHRYS